MIRIEVLDHDALLSRANDAVLASFPDEADPTELLETVSQDVEAKRVIRLVAIETGGENGGETDGRVVGVAVGNVRDAEAGLDLIAVVPEARGRRVSSQLLEAFEREAIALGAVRLRAGGSVVRYAWPGVDTRYGAAISLLLRHGYRRTDQGFHMSVDLVSDFPADPARIDRLAELGIEIRAADQHDIPGIAAFASREFTDTWANEMTVAIRQPESGAFVALAGDSVIGFAGYSVYRRSLFGPLATDPTRQGGGVGGELLRLSLNAMRASGVAVAQISWAAEDAVPFYRRSVGAEIAATFWIMTKPVEPGTAATAR